MNIPPKQSHLRFVSARIQRSIVEWRSILIKADKVLNGSIRELVKEDSGQNHIAIDAHQGDDPVGAMTIFGIPVGQV